MDDQLHVVNIDTLHINGCIQHTDFSIHAHVRQQRSIDQDLDFRFSPPGKHTAPLEQADFRMQHFNLFGETQLRIGEHEEIINQSRIVPGWAEYQNARATLNVILEKRKIFLCRNTMNQMQST